jgi:hypothetical protein
MTPTSSPWYGPVCLVCPSIAHSPLSVLTLIGQESGNGLVDILYGATSPSGKLPYTIAKQASDYGASVSSGQSDTTWDLLVDYRRFDQNKIEPRFEFGFGLCEYPIYIYRYDELRD